MKQRRTGNLFFWLMGLLLLVSACKPMLPTTAPVPTEDEQKLMLTSIAQVTLAAQLTATAMPQVSDTPQPARETPQPTLVATIARTPTLAPTSQGTGFCNMVGMGVPFDMTVPDDTEFLPGELFTKTWRLVNNGSCKWTRLYKLIFYSQNPMGAQYEQYLSGEVLPGYAVDLSIDFTAPVTPGVYQSNWMLQAPDGTLFGMGMNADTPFYVRIRVVDGPTVTPGGTLTPTP